MTPGMRNNAVLTPNFHDTCLLFPELKCRQIWEKLLFTSEQKKSHVHRKKTHISDFAGK